MAEEPEAEAGAPAAALTAAAALQLLAAELDLDPSMPPKQLAAAACRELGLDVQPAASLR